MVPFLFSFSALGNRVKIFLIGGLFETCRRWFGYFYEKAVESFYMSATFDEGDVSYQWIMVWLSKQSAWARIRQVEVSTDTYGVDRAAVHIDEDDDEDATNTRNMFYIPSPSKVYTMWYKGRYLTITRSQEQGRWGKDNKLHLTLMTRDHKMLADLLKEARKAYMSFQEDKIQVARREKRSLSSIVLDPGVKDLIVADARDFLGSRKWYTERGIPFRRGYLLYGAPGSGKTSLIHSLASELELDVYIISLSRIGLDDSGLDTLINELPERCVALMEDIDAVFTHGLTREPDEDEKKKLGDKDDGEDKDDDNRREKKKGIMAGSTTSHLSGLLNALNGIGAQEDRILFATTNKYTSLDPALCRPGRMDLHIEFKLANRYQMKELFKRFYNPNNNAHEDDEEKPRRKSRKDDEKDVDDTDYNISQSNSSSASSSPLLTSSEPSSILEVDASKPSVSGAMHQDRHAYAPRLSKRELEAMSTEFADTIPEREVSMASLQGYLMVYKIRPQDAVKIVGEWVEGELRGKREKQRRKTERAGKRRQAEEKKRKEEEKKEVEVKEGEPASTEAKADEGQTSSSS
ncbi:hypothetical protein V5O48_015747 [Marasmius crinis-equi]|uniref:P-loop containing nucleoside triphosphate hydrolase protein n=1 Tax=Marasmius crinis-equi TaxID=585013 RepID=A0ABR3ETR4_9AGAR